MIVLLLLGALVAAGIVVALLRLSPPGAPVAKRITLEPIGVVRAPMQRFVWGRLEGAERFRLELAAQDGSLIWTTTTTDTSAATPRGLEFLPDQSYRWKVTTLFTDGISLESDEETFQVLPPSGSAR